MSSLPTTEVMGSTPGRHLEITGVSDGKQQISKEIRKGAEERHSLTFFLFK